MENRKVCNLNTMAESSGNTEIYDLRINDLIAPMGIDDAAPRFSWKMNSNVVGAKQNAYCITVTSETGDEVWNTGWVESDTSIGIRYAGAALQSATGYTVLVRVKSQHTAVICEISSVFEMGFLGDNPLGDAQWITIDSDVDSKNQKNLPVYRKAFETKPDVTIVKARLYTTALGVYESYINGQRVGRLQADGTILYEELKPGYTQMEDRKAYSTFDVTRMLQDGQENVLSAVVTTGWWNGASVQLMMPEHLIFKESAYMAKLVITYSDGSATVMDTDLSWKADYASAVQYGTGLWEGEVYDAGVEESWMLPGYCDGAWYGVKINREFKGVISAFRGVPVLVRKDLERAAQSITVYHGATGVADDRYGKINVVDCFTEFGADGVRLKPGETLLIDFGQNFAGRECLELKAKAGTRIDVKHGEMLNDNCGLKSRANKGPEGSLYNFNYTRHVSTVGRTIYYASGNENGETYHPTFSFYGFRYMELMVDAETTFYNITGQVVTSALEDTGTLVTSSDDVNKLISNIRWGMYSNYLSIPSDCPQRDERQAWTADTQIFTEAGCYLTRSKSFMEKYMVDLCDAQDPITGSVPGVAPTGYKHGANWGTVGWADAIVHIPWFLYQMYGDTSVIEEHWDAMMLYMDKYMASTNGMGGNYGTMNGPDGEKVEAYGDWMSPENRSQDVSDRLSVAYYAWDAMLMAKMAKAIGKNQETIKKFELLYQEEKALFQEKYVTQAGIMDMDVQSVCLYALYLDLLPEKHGVVEQLISNIEAKGNRLGTGFLGTAILMYTLSKIGRTDVAYKLLLQHEYPSWLYSVDQGATTIWERWNSYTLEKGFFVGETTSNSFNHYSYGAVLAWMFKKMAGIGCDEMNPGFKHIQLAPNPARLISEVNASYQSAYGMIVSNMHYEGNRWIYQVTIPANTTATILLPVKNLRSLVVNGLQGYANTHGLVMTGYDSNRKTVTFEAQAGSYEFCV